MNIISLKTDNGPFLGIEEGKEYFVYAETFNEYVIAFSHYTISYPKSFFKMKEE